MASVVSAGMQHEAEVGDIVGASLHARLVHAAGRSAMRITGKHADIAHKDRVALLQHAKFLPIPRNATMNVDVNVEARASANSQAAAVAARDPSMPSFMKSVSSVQGPRERVQKELIAGVVTLADTELVED
jgi:hypothetical protein